ncbi:MAG: hypothetical protein AAF371_18710, partial [Pseudomonadota bacterium]
PPEGGVGLGPAGLGGGARRGLWRGGKPSAEPGDVLLFRMRAGGPAKHAAILAAGTVPQGRMIHAYSGHAVCETGIGPAWGRRLAGVFRFPETRSPGGA